MYNKTDTKVNPTIVNDYCTFGVSITELQVTYKRSFRMETRTQGQKNTLTYIYIPLNQLYYCYYCYYYLLLLLLLLLFLL